VKNKLCLKINTDLAASQEVLSWFEQINQPPIPNQVIWWQCQTLLIEGFANIIEHAHKNLPIETPIEIEAVRLNEHIEIRIWSQGEAFDLEQHLREISEFEDNDQERGRGLKIMSAMADKLTYERTADNRYCLFISKYY
jgi:serine/threonine-protein kinase RsbW